MLKKKKLWTRLQRNNGKCIYLHHNYIHYIFIINSGSSFDLSLIGPREREVVV